MTHSFFFLFMWTVSLNLNSIVHLLHASLGQVICLNSFPQHSRRHHQNWIGVDVNLCSSPSLFPHHNQQLLLLGSTPQLGFNLKLGCTWAKLGCVALKLDFMGLQGWNNGRISSPLLCNHTLPLHVGCHHAFARLYYNVAWDRALLRYTTNIWQPLKRVCKLKS